MSAPAKRLLTRCPRVTFDGSVCSGALYSDEDPLSGGREQVCLTCGHVVYDNEPEVPQLEHVSSRALRGDSGQVGGKGSCRNGHPYAIYRVISRLRNGSTRAHCRACKTEQQRQYMEAGELVTLTCPVCRTSFERPARKVRQYQQREGHLLSCGWTCGQKLRWQRQRAARQAGNAAP